MKKLTLAMTIGTLMSTAAVAGHHDTKITSDFASLDSDSNDYVSVAEFEREIEGSFMAKMDANMDEMITREEFESYVEQNPSMFSDDIVVAVKAEGTTDAVITREVTTKKVADGDVISEKNKELRTEISMSADAKFDNIDMNGNGELSMKELKMAEVKGDFEDMDRNADALITKTEYPIYFEEIDSE
ncbi:hypothetical protein [Alteromonas sp. A079]|uniref:hypothetical protein n=1 Tax=Alteromonas sp. A079 TaxID=3410268 RepID=UPI003BA02637